jgi:hypothetical protein
LKKLEIDYPWALMEQGDAIFVPTLNEDITREEGLKSALSFGRTVKYQFGIFDGKLGILFTVKQRRSD